MIDATKQTGFEKPTHFFWWRLRNDHPLLLSVSLSIVSGMMLAFPFLLPDYFLLSWFAFVPVLIAVENLKGASGQYLKVYLLGLIFGLVFYLCVAYWIVDFLILFKGYAGIRGYLIAFAFWIFCAQLPALLFTVFVWLRKKKITHDFLLFPILVITFYAAFPGISFSQLGESQSEFRVAIQATEFVGVHGLDGILALVNILLVYLVLGRVEKISFSIAGIFVVFWFSYGFYSYAEWQNRIANWETLRIGIVQPDDVPSVREINSHRGYSRALPPEMAMTERLVAAGAELVVWPEARYKNYFDSENIKQAYLRNVKQLDANLIFQDLENVQSSLGNQRFNSVAAITGEGDQLAVYRKNLRIIFGEYLPEFQYLPFLSTWFRGILGDFNAEISAGDGHQYFSIDGKTIIPLVCYETLFPNFVAETVSEHGQGSILVGLSNDSWFGKTIQTYQHINSSKLRAVENRLPFIIALNGGPSLIVMPNGEVSFKTDAFQAGGYLAEMPYSNTSGGSFFSRHPYLFLYGVYASLALIFLSALVGSLGRKLIRNGQ